MDESHLFVAIRYVEMNPVAAGMVSNTADYRWSSARDHIEGTDDMLASVFPPHSMIPIWEDFLRLSSDEELKTLKRHEHTGRLLGSDSFVDKLEQTMVRILRPQKPGPKKKKDS